MQYLRTSSSGNNSLSNSSINSSQNQYATNNILSQSPSISNGSDNKSSELNIYPNPTQSEINIAGLSNIKSIEVMNSTMQTINVMFGNQNKIDVSSLASGMYFLRIYYNNRVTICKFIKE